MRSNHVVIALSQSFLVQNQSNPALRSFQRVRNFIYSILDWGLIAEIFKSSTQRIFCLDASMEFWVISYLIGQFKNEQGDSTDYQAAATLIANSTNFKICFTLFPLMSFFTLGSQLLGKINPPSHGKLKRIETEDVIEDMKYQYSRLPRNILLVGAPFALAAMSTAFFSNRFWPLLGKSSEVVDLIQQFLIPLSFTTPIISLRFITEAILFMGNKNSVVMRVSMTCWALFGVFTSYFLGMGGIGELSFPALKIPGVFLGFLGQMSISWLILMGVVKKSAAFKDFHFLKDFFKWTPEDARQVREIIPNSLAYWFATVSELTAQLGINVMAANLGVPQLAAQNFVAEINFFFLLWTYALAQVGQQLVGNAIGADDRNEAGKIAKYTLGMSFLPAPFYLLFALKPTLLTSLTLSIDNDVLQYTDTLIPYACISSIIYTFQYVMLEALRPTKKYFRPLSFAILGLWSGVLVSYYLSKEQDIYGIARGSLLGSGLAMAGVGRYFVQQFLMEPRDESYPPAEEVEPESRSESVTDYIDNPAPPQARASSNHHGCFGCLNRLYNRLFASKKPDLTESRADLQTSRRYSSQ